MFSYNSIYEKLVITVTSLMIMRIYYHTALTYSVGGVWWWSSGHWAVVHLIHTAAWGTLKLISQLEEHWSWFQVMKTHIYCHALYGLSYCTTMSNNLFLVITLLSLICTPFAVSQYIYFQKKNPGVYPYMWSPTHRRIRHCTTWLPHTLHWHLLHAISSLIHFI
jgi:hypothetical protein